MLPQFIFSTYPAQIFWLVITFGCMYFTMVRIIVPMTVNIKDARTQLHNNNLHKTEEITRLIENLKKQYEEQERTMHMDTEHIKQNSLILVKQLASASESQLNTEIEKHVLACNEELKHIKGVFHDKKEALCLELATAIANKIAKINPDQELLKSCYSKIRSCHHN